MRVVTFTQDFSNTCHIARTAECLGFELSAVHFESRHRRRSRVPRNELFPVGKASLESIQQWQKEGNRVIALQENGISPSDVDWQETDIILVGRETGGIPEKYQDSVDISVWIPMEGHVRCLNAADAAVVTMWEARKGRSYNETF